MKKIYLPILILFFANRLFSQSYVFDSIPDNLKSGANAVVRTDQCLFTLLKPGNAVKKIKRAITLLNANTINYRYLQVPYNKSTHINYIRGTIYDENGHVTKILGTSDIFDVSAMGDGTFYSDDRIKLMYFPLYKFPYTVEYEYEVELTDFVNYPTWYFMNRDDVSVQTSGIQVIVPSGMRLRYQQVNLKTKVDSITLEGKTVYTWKEENLAAYQPEVSSVRQANRTPSVSLAPVDFEIMGFKGTMKSWKDFGSWAWELIKNRDVLSQSEINDVRELTSKSTDNREKVKLVYEYMQSRTRYVSVQIGIGGYQPAEASDVSKTGFGDCKALVNYTCALLKAVGINSFHTWIKAGDYVDETDTGFVNDEFDHVILCVPMPKDTIWLECTNQTSPFNFLGTFTGDRVGLMIAPDGGKLVRTHKYSAYQSQKKTSGTLYLNILGNSSGKISEYYSGINYDYAAGNYALQSDEEIRKVLYKNLKFIDFVVSSPKYSENKSEIPSGQLTYDINIKNFAPAQGLKLYFNPSFQFTNYLPEKKEHLIITYPSTIKDSLVYVLPLNFTFEYVPSDMSIKNEFGKFVYQVQKAEDKLIFIRSLELYKSDIPEEKYDLLRTFFNTIAKVDREKIILVRKGG